jgi:hypothetical protein
MNNPTQPLEERIRNAVTAGDYAKANALWMELGDRLRLDSAAGRIPIARLRQAHDLSQWCRTMAIVGRARCQQRLCQLAVSSRYLAQPVPPRQRLLARG